MCRGWKYLFFVLFVLCEALSAQEQHLIAFYNVSNLMDVYNDPLTQDDDMLPNADREWTKDRYSHKLSSVARVVADLANEGDFPSLLALAEVENKIVLEDLVAQEAIKHLRYEYVHYDSSDERGIDVALLYRADKFRVERSLSLKPEIEQPTRDYLVVWGELCGEPMLVIVVHLPSRIGGRGFTSVWRERCAAQLREFVDSVRIAEPKRKVIIMGDMNDTPLNRSVKQALGATTRLKDIDIHTLYNPFGKVKGRGSMVYQDRWYQYDQIIVSSDLLSHCGLSLMQESGCSGFIFSQPYMLDARGYPLPTYKATEYLGGVSDHLPVYVILRRN